VRFVSHGRAAGANRRYERGRILEADRGSYLGRGVLRRVPEPKRGSGGGSRTRTYEGLASGFTVRPLCRSGHSPMSAKKSPADKNAPGWPRRIEARLMLPPDAACQLEISRRIRPPAAAPPGSAGPRHRSAPPIQATLSARALYGKGRFPTPVSTASRPCAPSAAGHRPSRRRDHRQDNSRRRRRRGRRFRDRRRPRRFRSGDNGRRRFPP
jgi:hypothetical protein